MPHTSRLITPIALCITELNRGGAELAFCEIVAGMDRTVFDPVVYCLQSRPQDSSQSYVEKLEEAGVKIHFLDIRGFFSLFVGFFKFRRLLKRQRPRVFQSFLFHANFLGRWAARSAGVKRIFSGIRVAEKSAFWHLSLDRISAFLVEKYICVSRSVADFTIEKGRIPASKVLVIPNGIDPERFSNTSRADFSAIESVPNSRKAICIGRIHPQKGIDWLLQIAPKWLRELPNWELLIIGTGTPQYVEQCVRQRDRLEDEIRNRIHFLGWRTDVDELLRSSDLFLLPSRWEGMPNVLLQSMLCALPVLCTRAEGVLELLGETAAGPQNAEFGNEEEFCAKLRRIATDPEFALRLARDNEARIREEFPLEKMIRAYENLWKETE